MFAKSLGQEGYEAYLLAGPYPGETFDRRPMPSWEDLDLTEAGRITKARWEAAAVRIAWITNEANRKAGSDPSFRAIKE